MKLEVALISFLVLRRKEEFRYSVRYSIIIIVCFLNNKSTKTFTVFSGFFWGFPLNFVAVYVFLPCLLAACFFKICCFFSSLIHFLFFHDANKFFSIFSVSL